jgi:hypothetical protein
VATRFALRSIPDRRLHDGAWWPESRHLTDQLGQLFALWPASAGRIVRVLYSPPDWDDHPRAVLVPGGRVKTGCFPQDDTRQLILSMLDGSRRTITVVPPETSAAVAAGILSEVDDAAGLAPRAGARPGADQDHPVWDNEGGHP